MSNEPETVTFCVKIVDADEKPIREGSVLWRVDDVTERGVVTRIVRQGDTCWPYFSSVGDLLIRMSQSCTRCSNTYSKWRHIPHDKQTYFERFLSWSLSPEVPDVFNTKISKDQSRAISGIMNLLPEDAVDWEYEQYPDTLEEALLFLARHIESVSK